MQTKLYLQNSDIYDKLWERLITWYDPYTISNFSTKLQNYIKQEKNNILKKIYVKIFNKNESNISLIKNEITKLIQKTEKAKDIQWLYNIYDIFLDIETEKESIENFKIDNVLFNLLTNFSKKKVLWYNLKRKYPQKEWETLKDYKCRLKKIINDISWIYKEDSDIITDMLSIWMDELFYRIAIEFWNNASDGIQNIINNWDVDNNNIEIIIDYLKESWVNEKLLNKLKQFFLIKEDVKSTLTKQTEEKISWEVEKKLKNIESSKRKIIADFNPFLLELWFETWIKTLGYNRFLEIYEKVFYNIAQQILDKTKSYYPSFNKFLKFDSKKIE